MPRTRTGIWSQWSTVCAFTKRLYLLTAAAAPSVRDPNVADDWHIFNDFLVQPISKADALKFDPLWKLPSVLTYQLKTMSHQIDDRWKDQLDTSLLHMRYQSKNQPSEELVLLTEEDSPKPGTLVGIDAEFVSLQSEEIEIKADGSRETVRPSRLGLARVSVLRGEGSLQDVPFIDDYIATSEPIVDYLTAFSGIRPGDLDDNLSKHPLVTLKMAYKKLWLLLNLGCVFVGHGLLKDFRTINMHVPRSQVIDTVDLWFIKVRARKLNLRFLAWLLLHEDVQGGESHDSIEDARTALKLWRKYQEVQSKGSMEETLEWVYKRGRDVGFRAPNSQGHQRPGTIGSNGNNRLSGTDTTGRNTPEPGGAVGSIDRTQGWAAAGSGRAGAGTPVKKIGFGTERVGFGSPLR
jgi:PAB-dependent poly(A)-specific ribonuclease subunit 2